MFCVELVWQFESHLFWFEFVKNAQDPIGFLEIYGARRLLLQTNWVSEPAREGELAAHPPAHTLIFPLGHGLCGAPAAHPLGTLLEFQMAPKLSCALHAHGFPSFW